MIGDIKGDLKVKYQKNKGKKGISIFMDDRKNCVRCKARPRAINYIKNGRTYYRSLCDRCNTEESKNKKPRWAGEGYIKTSHCEICGFNPKYKEQLTVYDNKKSFKTVCLNCDAELKILARIQLKKKDLKPDF